MNVIVSGFTGSGKTSVAKALASRLSWSFVSGAKVREEMLQLVANQTGSNFWRFSSHSSKLDLDRLVDSERDKQLDARLAKMVSTCAFCVFDVWFVPWLISTRGAIKVWLDAPLRLRVDRLLADGSRTKAEILESISTKDYRAVQYAKRAYGFDLATDRTPFEIIIDTSLVPVDQAVDCLERLIRQMHSPGPRTPTALPGFLVTRSLGVRNE